MGFCSRPSRVNKAPPPTAGRKRQAAADSRQDAGQQPGSKNQPGRAGSPRRCSAGDCGQMPGMSLRAASLRKQRMRAFPTCCPQVFRRSGCGTPASIIRPIGTSNCRVCHRRLMRSSSTISRSSSRRRPGMTAARDDEQVMIAGLRELCQMSCSGPRRPGRRAIRLRRMPSLSRRRRNLRSEASVPRNASFPASPHPRSRVLPGNAQRSRLPPCRCSDCPHGSTTSFVSLANPRPSLAACGLVRCRGLPRRRSHECTRLANCLHNVGRPRSRMRGPTMCCGHFAAAK